MKLPNTQKIVRDRSLFTGLKNMKPLYTFKNFPVFMGCVTGGSWKKDLVSDMEWDICPRTGLIQLQKLIPLKFLYLNQHNDGIGSSWQEHYRAFARFLHAYRPKKILEIGSAHDYIAKQYLDLNPQATWTSVEPNPVNIHDSRVRVMRQWFDEKFIIDQPVDAIVHSHILEHAYDPVRFIQHISELLKKGDKHIFTFPHLLLFLKKKYTNGLNFEHTLFLTEYFTDHFLTLFGFKILKKQYYKDHSIFYATEKTDTKITVPVLRNKYRYHKKLFVDFVNYHTALIGRLNTKIARFKGPLYLFGAHIFSQYLFHFGLTPGAITGILDNSTHKQGKRLYGTPFTVYSPAILKNMNNVGVIVKTAHYRDEIVEQIHTINPHVVIFE